jgi:hypothetical protein
MKMQATTLLVNFGTSCLQVAHYNGRYFLRDGYHRAAGLVRAGITVVRVDSSTLAASKRSSQAKEVSLRDVVWPETTATDRPLGR